MAAVQDAPDTTPNGGQFSGDANLGTPYSESAPQADPASIVTAAPQEATFETRIDSEAVRPTAADSRTLSDPAVLTDRAGKIFQTLRLNLQPGGRKATIQLTPVELGRLEIRIEVQDSRVTAMVRVERPEALEALRTHLPELRATLEQRGLAAEEIELSLGLNEPGDEASAQRHQREADPRFPRGSKTWNEVDEHERVLLPDSPWPGRLDADGVDTLA